MKCDFCQEAIENAELNRHWGMIIERNGRRPLCITCLKAITGIGFCAIAGFVLGR